MNLMKPPDRFVTERLVLRRWLPVDAPLLKAAIDSSIGHLQAWLPWAMNEPTLLVDIESRLAGFSSAFDAGREWIYGGFSPDAREAFGGIGFHPRGEAGAAPDCMELGYWLRGDATGRGYVTEAASAAVVMASALPGITRLEIRCDPRNARSAAVPRRLG